MTYDARDTHIDVHEYLLRKYGRLGPPFPGGAWTEGVNWRAYATASVLPDPLAPPEREPCKPDNTEITLSADTTCDVEHVNGVRVPGGRCGRPGVVRKFWGCGHEHIGYVDICAAHHGQLSEIWTCHCGAQIQIMKTEPIGS
jgi:hypothetical protein